MSKAKKRMTKQDITIRVYENLERKHAKDGPNVPMSKVNAGASAMQAAFLKAINK